MVISLFELDESEIEYFKSELSGNELSFVNDPIDVGNAKNFSNSEAIIIFVRSRVDKEVLDSLPNLKFISTMSTGYDHIDVEECKKRGITVSNVPSYGEATVAEHTFALLLAVSRRMIESVDRVRKGNFSPSGLTGFELRGKTLGVLGVGSIGKNVIKIAKGFGMNVIAYKRTPDYSLEKELGFKFVDVPVLYSQADIITLHLPYNKETEHFVNEESFSMMKDGVVIINTARGGLIDSMALINALHTGKVKAAGIDVLEEEPVLLEEREFLLQDIDREKLMSVLQDHVLVNHPNVVVTPHNAFNSDEALKKIIETTHENIDGFFNNSPVNVVSA